MSEELSDKEVDITVGPTGVTGRAKGYRLADIALAAVAGGVIYIAVMVNVHEAGANEKNTNIVSVIKEQIQIQRETLNAQREANCLSRLSPEQRKRQDEIEFCRSLGKGH